ncbi:hypothetical protein A2U01_0021683, partial [Trifolium medium]|nr:hypothetical protein [Trifolium medium]
KSKAIDEASSSFSVARSTTQGKEVFPREFLDGGVQRNSPSRHQPGKKPSTSLSSAGAVLCCSSLNSSDIRNCNKRFIVNYEHDAARKVWQGAIELGVEGEEEEERYVERILINENRVEATRVLREQQQQSFP